MSQGLAAAGRPAVVLTIAGFDPSSGAGITADLQTLAALGLFGTAVVTALTVQSTRGVRAVQTLDPEWLRASLRELCADLPPAGVKIGMLGSAAMAKVVAEFLREGRRVGATVAAPARGRTVLDPVLRASSGQALLEAKGMAAMHDLLELVGWVTPNWAELAALTGVAVGGLGDAEAAAGALAARHPGLGVVATGGEEERPVDLLRSAEGEVWRLEGERVETSSTHGTGCAFSTALTAGLVAGKTPLEAARDAKAFVTRALRDAPGLGGGRGPMGLLPRRSLDAGC